MNSVSKICDVFIVEILCFVIVPNENQNFLLMNFKRKAMSI
jgi:hypothetical protein